MTAIQNLSKRLPFENRNIAISKYRTHRSNRVCLFYLHLLQLLVIGGKTKSIERIDIESEILEVVEIYIISTNHNKNANYIVSVM